MDYTRQQSLRLHLPKSVWVVGCGGVGYWTAYQLALAGVPELVLFDSDTVSESNFDRIPYVAADKDRNKARVLSDAIYRVRPDIVAVAFEGAFSPEVVDGDTGIKPEWLVATTDTWASRKMCYEWCQTNGVNYMEASAEGEYGSIAFQPAEFATPDEEHPGYASVPVWSGPCVAAGLLITAHIIHDKEMMTDTVRIGWDGTKMDLFAR
jgi:tRNA A37 threonylcarbamoyladenosine dehydratase